MHYLNKVRAPGQLGGMPYQQVQYGSQSVRTFCSIMDAAGYSTGVVFLDLATAFHKLIRELVSGCNIETDLMEVLTELVEQGFSPQEVNAAKELPPVLEALGVPPFLVQMLREVHSVTWFSLGPLKQTSVTRKGTRPGSPLADLVFHILMHDLLHEFNLWVKNQIPFQDILRKMDVPGEVVTWSDDVAVPWACSTCQEIPVALARIVETMNRLVRKRGMTLNFDKGKTSAVATLRGPGAPALRKTLQLTDCPGVPLDLDGKPGWLHLMPAYKHLGSIFTSCHSIDKELAVRIGMAQATFAELSRPILCNRRIDLQVRFRLFLTFVGSKLYFGMGSWPTPGLRQLQRLRGLVQRMVKRVMHLQPDQAIPLEAQKVLIRLGILEPRVRLAVDRLLYAHKLWWRGPAFLQHTLLLADGLTQNSWVAGLKADLEWLFLHRQAEPTWEAHDLTGLIDFWQAGGVGWRKFVKAALRQYGRQEALMLDAHHYHRRILADLRSAGAEFEAGVDADQDELAIEFPCHCGRVFSTSVGLATHQRKTHGLFCPERPLLAGYTCPACLKAFHSTARLQQHLAYISRKTGINQCFQHLKRRGYRTDYEAARSSLLDAGLHRVEAAQAAGPLLPNDAPRLLEVQQADRDLERLRAGLQALEAPPDEMTLKQTVFKQLSEVTMAKVRTFQDQQAETEFLLDIADDWLGILLDVGEQFHEWSEKMFLHWGEHILPDDIAQFVDGEAELVVENCYSDLVNELPRFQTRAKISSLEAFKRFAAGQQDKVFPHRAIKWGRASCGERTLAALQVPSLFLDQKRWLAALRTMKWTVLPPDQKIPRWITPSDRPCFLIIHLFSGRRRTGDFHDALHREAEKNNMDVVVLSCDTAVSLHYGNLQDGHEPWENILRLCSQGRVTAALCGPPCETFTEARYYQPTDEEREAALRPWPRPLRSFEELFGLCGLTAKEIRQVGMGSAFFLQCMQVLAWLLIQQGIFICEHPWKPTLAWRPSIWTSPIVSILETHPAVKLWHMPQWKWGCKAIKPTGLLAANLPYFGSSMYARSTPGAQRPQTVVIGKDESTGQFRTHDYKEYPTGFCAALAGAIVDRLAAGRRSGELRANPAAEIEPALVDWVGEAAQACSHVREEAPILADYQGRWVSWKETTFN